MDRDTLWRMTADAAPNGIVLIDHELTILDCNTAFSRFLEKPVEKLQGKDLRSEVRECGKSGFSPLLETISFQGNAYIGEFSDGDNLYRLFLREMHPEDKSPSIYYLFLENMNIKEEEEGRIHISHKKLKHLLDNTNDAILVSDKQGKPVYFNKPYAEKMKELLGLDMQPGVQPHKLLQDSDAVAFWETLHRDVLSGKSFTRVSEFEFNGEMLYFEHVFHPVYEDDGIIGFTEFTRDITDRRKAQLALQQERALMQQYLDVAGVILVVINTDHSVGMINNKGCDVLGYKRGDIIGKNWFERFLPEGTRETVRSLFAKWAGDEAGLPEYYENDILRADGSRRTIAWHNAEILDDEGRKTGALSSGEDITERLRIEDDKKSLEEIVFHSQKMEAIGTLAGGIAHDFNNLLTGILGHANLLQMKTDPGDDRYNSILTISKAAERAADLTSQLLGFARKGKHQTVSLNMQDIITEVTELLRHTLDRNIVITTKMEADNPVVCGDPNQLHQVILNLALNSRDAMPTGGRLLFRTADFIADENFTKTRPESRPGEYLHISVIDSGSGIPPDIQDRIFDPFFSTKETETNSGMGLAMVYGIIRNHDGFMEVESSSGKGTEFRIYLPLMKEEDNGSAAREILDTSQGKGHILLIDDEESVLDITSKLLQQLRYTVTVFQDPGKAVEWYESNYSEIDLVILDMIMPGIDGRQCFSLLKKINPHLKVIISTGYDLDGRGQKILNSGLAGLIRKPYNITELGHVIKGFLK